MRRSLEEEGHESVLLLEQTPQDPHTTTHGVWVAWREPTTARTPWRTHPAVSWRGVHMHAACSCEQTHGACWSSVDTCTRTMHALMHLLSDRCRASVASSDELHGLFRTKKWRGRDTIQFKRLELLPIRHPEAIWLRLQPLDSHEADGTGPEHRQ